jgi:hypothetical protein
LGDAAGVFFCGVDITIADVLIVVIGVSMKLDVGPGVFLM